MAEAIVGKENAPTYSAFQKRITKLGCTFADKGKDGTASVWFSDGGTKAEIKLFAFDSTGLKPTNRGDWMTEKWGTRRGFHKDCMSAWMPRTKKIYAVAITDDKCGDSPQFEGTGGAGFCKRRKVAKRRHLCRHGSRRRRCL